MGKLAPEIVERLTSSCVSDVVPLQTELGEKNILVADAQKHVFKTPVYNMHLFLFFFFKGSLSGIALF